MRWFWTDVPSSALPEWFQEQKRVANNIAHEVPETKSVFGVLSVGKEVIAPVESSRDVPNTGADAARRVIKSLIHDQKLMKQCQSSVDTAISSISSLKSDTKCLHPGSPTTGTVRPKSCSTTTRRSNNQEDTKKEVGNSSRIPRKSKVHDVIPALNIPKAISKAVTDYSSIFTNFFCIMTSFYEKAKDVSSAKSIIQNGDACIRYQLKLYSVWKNIMYDYATVFGIEGKYICAVYKYIYHYTMPV